MSLSPEEQKLRDPFFQTLLATARSLQPGPDPEVTLEALIDAAQMLQDHLQRELTELRQEQADSAPARAPPQEKRMQDTNGYAALWDVDGTLVDTAEQHFRAWAAMAHERGRPFHRDDFTRTFGRRNPEIIHILFGDGVDGPEALELADRKERIYREAAAGGVELLPGVRTLLEDLDRAGFRQAVGSSAPRANLELILRLTGVVRYFPAVIAAEDTRRGKPDPQVFLLAAERLGVPPERCVVLEDAVAGVEAAKAGGMKCIAVRFVGHHSEAALRAAGADLVTETLESVTAEAVRRLFPSGRK